MPAGRIAVLIPCFNEEHTVGEVIKPLRAELPEAGIYVGDNNSTDATAAVAKSLGAAVISERRRGKGNMVKTLLAEVDADVFVMIDGDGTYSVKDIRRLIEPVLAGECDMCIGNRLSSYQAGSFSCFHLLGNKLIRLLTKRLHKVDIPDMLTGYRAMSRKLVDGICLIMSGFEIETEINIKSVWHGFKICSIDTEYKTRSGESSSKIKTFTDGYRILSTIFMLLREHQPMTMGGMVFLGLNLLAGVFLIMGLARAGFFAFAAALFLSLLGAIALSTGIILHAVNISHRESEELMRKFNRRRP